MFFPRISVSRFWLLFPHCDFPDLWIFRNIMISAVWTTLNKQLASEGRDQSLVFFEHWRPTHYHLSCFRHLLFIAYIEATGPREISSGVMAAAANGYIRTLALTFVGFQTEVSSGLVKINTCPQLHAYRAIYDLTPSIYSDTRSRWRFLHSRERNVLSDDAKVITVW